MGRRKKNLAAQTVPGYEDKIARLAEDFARRHAHEAHESEIKRKQDDAQRKERCAAALSANLDARTYSELLTMFHHCLERMEGKKRPSQGVRELHSAIIKEWERRYEGLREGVEGFDWPSSEARSGFGGFSISSAPEIGMLSALGYHVGNMNGVSNARRRLILDHVFSGGLPPMVSIEYMRGWGRPSTDHRLQKLANTLASMARITDQKRSRNCERAIEEWREDLAYLKAKYYRRYFGFPWPSIG